LNKYLIFKKEIFCYDFKYENLRKKGSTDEKKMRNLFELKENECNIK
jgi:hypothetical protein